MDENRVLFDYDRFLSSVNRVAEEMPQGIRLQIRTYEEMDKAELYALLHIRSQVFVVEQNCVYQDIDYHDQTFGWSMRGISWPNAVSVLPAPSCPT